jgi:hypothetical protein
VVAEGVQLFAATPLGTHAALRENGHPEPPAHDGEELVSVKLQPQYTGRHHSPPRPGALSGNCSQPKLLAAASLGVGDEAVHDAPVYWTRQNTLRVPLLVTETLSELGDRREVVQIVEVRVRLKLPRPKGFLRSLDLRQGDGSDTQQLRN